MFWKNQNAARAFETETFRPEFFFFFLRHDRSLGTTGSGILFRRLELFKLRFKKKKIMVSYCRVSGRHLRLFGMGSVLGSILFVLYTTPLYKIVFCHSVGYHLFSWRNTSPLVVYRSNYRTSLPGDFIRIRLKIEQSSRLFFFDIFSSAIMNDLFMTFTSRLKVDAKCVYQQWNWITVANYFGTPPADWVHGYLYFEPGAWIWTKRFRRYLHIVKNWSGNFSLNSSRVRALGWPLLGHFSAFFLFFWWGSVGQIIYREYLVFRGSNISCSLASTGPGFIPTW